MSRRLVLVVPEAPARPTSVALSRRLPTLAAVRLGVLDNTKANADALLDDLVEALRSTYGIGSVVRRRKAHPSYPAPQDMIEELSREADCVVTAMGD